MRDGLLEFDGEDLGEGGDGEGGEDGDEDEDELVEDNYGFPPVGPVLEMSSVLVIKETTVGVDAVLTSGSSALLVGCGMRISF